MRNDETPVNDKADAIAASDRDRAQTPPQLDAAAILASVGEALYRWDINNDVLTWSPNAAAVVRAPDVGAIGSGRGYAQLLDPTTRRRRSTRLSNPPSVTKGKAYPTVSIRHPA